MVCGNTFAKTICSICYEDLKPVVEDLQSISICGHVFHELCIQQWFEYCTNTKKKNCPVCKQTCSEANVSRLYFQSVGDPSLSQKPTNSQENPEELRREIEKLEGKVLELNSALERYQKDVKDLSEELCFSKEQAKKETASKNEALRQKASIQQLLHLKSGELDRSTSECTKLQERNMALAKELAALKLASDLNLEEEEVLRLASLGNKANSKDTVDILKKTLVIRNKSYKELMAKCNVLGRGETRSLRKLEKAKEKIKKLKARIQESEIAIEVKDNEVLRALKASKKSTSQGNVQNVVNLNPNSSPVHKCLNYQLEEPAEQKIHLDQSGSQAEELSCSRKTKKLKLSKDLGTSNTFHEGSTADEKGIGSCIIIDENASEVSSGMHKTSIPDMEPQVIEKNRLSKSETASDTGGELRRPCNINGVSRPRTGIEDDLVDTSFGAMDDDAVLLLDDIKQVRSTLNVAKETICPLPVFQAGDPCFSGGLLGPDGTRRHLGKWCKRVQDNGSGVSSVACQGSSTSPGNLIAVGADGRGGKIKVLRTLNQSLSDSRETSTWVKRCKSGSKTGSLPSQGCLQIEHFFGRAGVNSQN